MKKWIAICLLTLFPVLSYAESCSELFFQITNNFVVISKHTFVYSEFEAALATKYLNLGKDRAEMTRLIGRVRSYFIQDFWIFDSQSGRVLMNKNHPDFYLNRTTFPDPQKYLPKMEPPLSKGLIEYSIIQLTKHEIDLLCARTGNTLYLGMRFEVIEYDPFYQMATVKFANGSIQFIKNVYE